MDIWKRKGQSCLLINGDIESTCPLWSPNSRDIAYLSPVGNGKNQIFVKSLDGYEGFKLLMRKKESVHSNVILLARVFIMLRSQKNVWR